MGYIIPMYHKSKIKGIELLEGEPIENKIERITTNKEPITDGAPEIYTERKDGVISAYNIRTDRWEIATDAMDAVQGSIQAKREERQRKKDEKIEAKKEAKIMKMDGKPESTNGTND
jgi:hypothetical protein